MMRLIQPLAVALLLAAPQAVGAQATMFPPVRGTREMVAAANNFEVEAGFRMLAQGGNAVDAGVAAVLAAAVTEQSRFGLGGEMPALIKMAGKPVVVISGVGVAPAHATVDFYRNRRRELWEFPGHRPPIPEIGIRSAIVPGVFSGLLLALERYGTMSFQQVVAPAIDYADGFPLGEEFATGLRNHVEIIALWPSSRRFFYPGRSIPERGEVYREPQLAVTLRELARLEKETRGNRTRKLRAVRDLFYRGSLAKRMAAFSQENGGLITYEDLAGFQAETDRPRTTTYRGYEICKPGFWTQGPVLLQTLNLLEGFDLKAMEHNSPEYVHTVVEAMKLAYADRDVYYGDPRFSTIPEERLLSKQYATERRRLIDPHHASLAHRPGDLPGRVPMPAGSEDKARWAADTTCINVADKHGNVFSATPSGAWLPSVIAGDTGIPFTSRLQQFVLIPGHPNELEPLKRPRVTLSPTIVLKDGQPFLALSTPGGDNQDQALLQVLLNIVEFGMTPQEAVEAPRFQTEHFYSSFGFHEFKRGKLNLEARIPRETVEQLSALGHIVTVQGPWGNTAAPTVIEIRNGVLDAGADPRRSRFAFGR